jgi:hemoglobin
VTDEQSAGAPPPVTPYDDFGGEEFFTSLVAAFYARVAHDPILRPMYPDADLAAAERRLRLFLIQYWGGPTTYNDERGHPKLRMRHMDFTIDSAARDRWLSLMHDAMVEQDLTPDQETQLWMYLVSAAFAMQNVPDEPYGQPLPTETRS